MKQHLQDITDEIQRLLDDVCGDKNVSRQEYREFLEEVQTNVEASLDALKYDDERDAALARE